MGRMYQLRVDATDGGRKRRFTMDTANMMAIGILFLAAAAAVVTMVVTVGLVYRRVNGSDSFKIITACVGGSTISGVVAALLGSKSKGGR